jgi:hypothetical protein
VWVRVSRADLRFAPYNDVQNLNREREPITGPEREPGTRNLEPGTYEVAFAATRMRLGPPPLAN